MVGARVFIEQETPSPTRRRPPPRASTSIAHGAISLTPTASRSGKDGKFLGVIFQAGSARGGGRMSACCQGTSNGRLVPVALRPPLGYFGYSGWSRPLGGARPGRGSSRRG